MSNVERPADERFLGLQLAVTDLTGNVHNLVQALEAVAQLSAAQRQRAARKAADDELAAATQVEARSHTRAVRRVQRITGIVVTVTVPVVSVLAYWALTVQVNHQLIREQNNLVSSCQLRNEANVTIPRQRELALAAAARARHDPAAAKIHQDSADALATVMVDCTRFLKPH